MSGHGIIAKSALIFALLAEILLGGCTANNNNEQTAALSEASTAVTAEQTTKTATETTSEITTEAPAAATTQKITEKPTVRRTQSATAAEQTNKDYAKTAAENYLAKFKNIPSGGYITPDKEDTTKGYTILVNNSHKYNTSQQRDIINMMSIADRSFYVAYDNLDADRFTLTEFNLMNLQYKSNYGYKLQVCSGYRSYESQKRLFDNSVASVGEEETLKWYTRPGCSEHHTGYAIDYNTNSFGQSAFTGTGKEAWIRNNCSKYGFIHRYAANKQSITGVAPEAWHFRFVGLPHAKYIMDNDLCLEEYIEDIKQYSYSSPLSVTAGGSTYYVWYVKYDSGVKIELAGYSKYLLSGNNDGGFIVTAVK